MTLNDRILSYCNRVNDLKLYNDFLCEFDNVIISNNFQFDDFNIVYDRFENLLRRLTIIEEVSNDKTNDSLDDE